MRPGCPNRCPLAVLLIPSFFIACSTANSGGGAGSGGTSGSGGKSGTGGVSASGGASGSASGSGGATGSGGAASSGGAAASGGATGSGGNAAAGGAPRAGGNGAGGTTASAGATASAGTISTGGTTPGGMTATGGSSGAGGRTGAGGNSNAGVAVAAGGTSNVGGTGSGGNTASGGTTDTAACTDTSTKTYNFTKQYEDGSITVTNSTKTYYTMTNWWHKFGGQTVTINGLSTKLGNPQAASVPSSDGNPMGFPSMFIGTYQNKATVGSNLPKKVSDIASVPTIFNTNASSVDTANLNATYDVWFTATSAPLSSTMANNPGKGGAYLMVWLFKPDQRQPRGGSQQATGTGPNYAATTVSGIPGKWDVWVDKSDPLCISYVASDPIDGLTFDLNNFIQDSVSKQYGITTSMYLSIVFAGFEVWSGGDGLECKQFCAQVN